MSHSHGKEILTCAAAPKPIGPYSVAVKVCHFIFVSGQLGLNPQSGNLVEGGIKEQTTQVMENIKNILGENQASMDAIVKTTVFLKNIGDFAIFNDVYGGYFKSDPPARSTVQVAALPKDALVEIEVIASSEQQCGCGD
jgi:2-iminobutanoate/2-iminopropanoate deaminase